MRSLKYWKRKTAFSVELPRSISEMTTSLELSAEPFVLS